MQSYCQARRGSAQDMCDTLRRIDGKAYAAYRDLEGTFEFGGAGLPSFLLAVDKVQADPFAAPSRMHVLVPGQVAGFPKELFASKIRGIALCDYLTRNFWDAASKAGADQRFEGGGWHGAKGGEITIDKPGQHVLERSSVHVHVDGSIEARFTVALPARGRNITGQWALEILTKNLPQLVRQALLFRSLQAPHVQRHLECVEDQHFLREALPAAGLIGFVANNSILPRLSGNNDAPMAADEAIAFQSPPSLEVAFELPNRGKVTGMGVRPGVTLIVGGGFHGKSTLLQALEVGVYNHIPGDGREFVAMVEESAKVRAEDGRAVTGVNISPFIDNLPFGKSTQNFSTPDGSGSTSQAANIIESLEAGAKVLLVDEDTCATNFMIRDARMQRLVAKEKEPITPFISKVRALFTGKGVSSVLVIGGSGDYFTVADNVVMLDCYHTKDVSAQAKDIAADGGGGNIITYPTFGVCSDRVPKAASFGVSGKVVARGKEKIQYGDEDIDLSAVEQLVEVSQTRAIGDAMRFLASHGSQAMVKGLTMGQLLDFLDREFDTKGLDVLLPGAFIANYARPRRFEVAAAINRYRKADITPVT